MTTTRRLAAILAADVAGYSRLMGADEVGTLEALKAHRREVIDPAIAANRGRIVKTTGDGLLVEFASAVDAVTCAMGIQEQMAARGGDIRFRIGINIGDIISEGDDIFGDGVNVAARVENECEPGGVCLSGNAHEQVAGKISFAFDDLGERTLKNIARPVRLYAVRHSGTPRAEATVSSVEANDPLPLPDKPSIIVLPFANMSGDPEQEYFADGLTENVTTDLARFHELFVIGRNTAFSFKGKAIDLRRVGRELGVRYVLEGSVQRTDDRMRVNVQLVDATTGHHLWAERFDRDRSDLFIVQDEISRRVAYSLSVQLGRAERKRGERNKARSLDAADLVLRASADALMGTNPAKIQQRLDLYEQALKLDANNSDALAGIARNKGVLIFQGWSKSPADDLRTAMDFAERALALDPDDAKAVYAKGHVFLIKRDYIAALEAYEEAVKLNPSVPVTHQFVGLAKIYLGRSDEAIEHLSEAVRLSPRDYNIADFYVSLGAACWHLGRYAEAIDWLDRSLRQNSRIEVTHLYLASAKLRTGRQHDAEAAIKNVVAINPSLSVKTVGASPIVVPIAMAGFLDDLRKAGLPE
jgi:adenylate cyclase